jgi:hypothetical protein
MFNFLSANFLFLAKSATAQKKYKMETKTIKIMDFLA